MVVTRLQPCPTSPAAGEWGSQFVCIPVHSDFLRRVFDADDKFRKCERKKCKPQVQAWSLQSKQILKETYGRINIETASATEWKKSTDDFKASLEISNANVEKVKCAISKCEADMWEHVAFKSQKNKT